MNEIIQYYDQLAEKYDDDRFGNSYGRYIDAQERRILTTLHIAEETKVLDMACGTGRLLEFASSGVDGSEKMANIARNKFPNKSIFIADAEKLPFDDSSLDTVFCFHFFMHLDEEKIINILSECHRVLKPNGRLIFDIPSKKRRKLINYLKNDWHGNLSFDEKDIKKITNNQYRLLRTFGIMFLPIHRFPKNLRKYLMPFDTILTKYFTKSYSSYIVYELNNDKKN